MNSKQLFYSLLYYTFFFLFFCSKIVCLCIYMLKKKDEGILIVKI